MGTCALLAALFVGSVVLHARAEVLEDRDLWTERLRDGRIELSEVQSRHAGGIVGVRGVAMVDAPVSRVLQTLADFDDYSQFMPPVRRSRVLASNGVSTRLFLEAALPNIDARWAELSVRVEHDNGLHTIEAELRRGNVNTLYARWEIAPTTGRVRTLVAFELLVDPDLPLPDRLVNDAQRNAVRDSLSGLRSYIRGNNE